MNIETENEAINKLADLKLKLAEVGSSLALDFNIDIKSHREKIDKIIDNEIKKERIAILNIEIDKIKRGL